eukprot:COSAG01_NODE_12616_length_1710_cov_19.417132_2_plen_54_part_00
MTQWYARSVADELTIVAMASGEVCTSGYGEFGNGSDVGTETMKRLIAHLYHPV